MESVIDDSAVLTGKLFIDGDFTVEGKIEGEIEVSGRVRIAAGAVVLGPVKASEVEIYGVLEGDVNASNAVRLAAGGRIRGDVAASHIRVEDGGVMQGKVLIRSASTAKKPAPREDGVE